VEAIEAGPATKPQHAAGSKPSSGENWG